MVWIETFPPRAAGGLILRINETGGGSNANILAPTRYVCLRHVNAGGQAQLKKKGVGVEYEDKAPDCGG